MTSDHFNFSVKMILFLTKIVLILHNCIKKTEEEMLQIKIFLSLYIFLSRINLDLPKLKYNVVYRLLYISNILMSPSSRGRTLWRRLSQKWKGVTAQFCQKLLLETFYPFLIYHCQMSQYHKLTFNFGQVKFRSLLR